MTVITAQRVHKGMRLMYMGNHTRLTVLDVFREPRSGFAGSMLAPFAVTQWDDSTRTENVNLRDLESIDYRVLTDTVS